MLYVLSRNKFLSINKEGMKKLRRRDIYWIIRELNNGSSVYFIAKKRKVSGRWVRKIRAEYRKTGEVPVFTSPGRKPCQTPAADHKLILETWKQLPLSPANLENYLMIKTGKKISHNRIYRILKEAGKVKNEPKKQERRKWVRFERRHSNSMWHADWTRLDDGQNLIVYEDDASRFIVGYGIFKHATMENALFVFKKAAKEHGFPKQLLSDNGTQFRFNEMFDRPLDIENTFQKNLNSMGVKQIFTRVHHPQTNGKLERLFFTLKKLAKHFKSIKKAIDIYNYKRPHMSLRMEVAETPYEAFLRKRRK